MEIHIHLHHHYDDKLFTEIKSINTKINKIMATEQQFLDILGRIDTATTNIAEDIRGLKDQIANQGLPADVEANILSTLEAKAAQLESIAADTNNPVPGDTGGTDPNANL
jgi:hypothetical protein